MKLSEPVFTSTEPLTYFTFKHFSCYPHVKCAVFPRTGGYSSYPYHSLNVGIHVNDDSNSVIANREKALGELGFTLNNLIAMEQVHSDNLEVVTGADRGRGAFSWDDGIEKTDSLICNDKDLLLMAVVADCAAAVFYDPVKEVLGISHCGWRGTVKKLAVKTIREMGNFFNCHPSDIIVGISPCIDACCYEVSHDVFSEFYNNFGISGKTFFHKKNGSLHLDMKKALKFQLIEAGIKEEHLEVSSLCTSCRHDLFFSHRAEKGKTGRFGVMIGILSQ
ncbi:MAG: peptidoglycan editing factor PgeF [Candidatus Eremiobacterota bacterium]